MAQITDTIEVLNDSVMNGLFLILRVQVAFLLCFLVYRHIKGSRSYVKKNHEQNKTPSNISPVKNDVFSVRLKKQE